MDATSPQTFPAAPEPGPGTLVAGRYRVGKQVGSGGMGRVFEATDERLGRRVAVKLMSGGGFVGITGRELFEKESRLLAQLSHPGIVPLYEAGEDRGALFLVMDLVDGASLAQVLRSVREAHVSGSGSGRIAPRDARLLAEAIGRPLAPGRRDLLEGQSWYRGAAAILAQLSETLAAAHAAGVVHRDLKPGNVMLLGGGEPVVLDFGLAGHVDAAEGAVTRSLAGTVAYLAPEQVGSHRIGVDPRTDVYQLGLILYELLTLQRAFPGDQLTDVFLRIRNGVFPRPRKLNPSVPRDLEAICLKALELHPSGRYPSAQGLQQDLQRYLEGRDVPVAVRGNLARKLTRTGVYLARRHPVVAGATLALVAAGAAWSWLEWRKLPLRPRVLAAWRAPRDLELRPLRMDGTVELGDRLGVEVACGVPVYVYGLSVFGGEDPHEQWVRPCPPVPLGANAGDEPDRDGRWDLILPAGRHKVVISQLDAALSSPQDEHEGLLVFASTTPERWIERAFDTLQTRIELAEGEPVPFVASIQALVRGLEPIEVRGGPVADPGAERPRHPRAMLRHEHLDGTQPWPAELGELRRFFVMARVRAP